MASKRGKPKGIRMTNKIKTLRKQGLNITQIAKVLDISRNTVRKYLADNEGVAQLAPVFSAPWAGNINWQDVRKKTNDGTKLAHYFEENVDPSEGITYISFWREFKRRYPTIPLDLHKVHEPGQRCEFDFKGQDSGFGYFDRALDQFIPCRLFGNILCFSQLLFVRATHSEKQGEVFDALARSYESFGGIPEVTGFDNAKAQVIRADRYDADLNPEFSYFCEVYETAPIAARPRKPKDKNLIENALGVFWRWAGPKLKVRNFYSISELNGALEELCHEFNNRMQRKYGMSRREKFEVSEREKLKPLPATPYVSGEWRKHKPHADCHIQYRYNFYSVPHECRGKEVDVRVSRGTLEIFQGLGRVAIHSLLSPNSRGRYATQKNHLPDQHQAMLEQTPAYVMAEAERVGVETYNVIRRLIEEATHPLMYLRRCQGLLRLKKRYTSQQLEEACRFFKNVNLADIKISNVEQVIEANKISPPPTRRVRRQRNENLRGQAHWGPAYH